MSFFGKLLPAGITARLCANEPDCRVKPVQIDGGLDSQFAVNLFIENGNILGVAVSDIDSLDLVADVGETWDEDTAAEPETALDALNGQPLVLDSGWTITRRYDGEQHHFHSLTDIMTALNTGYFGITLWSNPTESADVEYEDWATVREQTCPEGTCSGCPDPEECSFLRSAEVPASNGAGIGAIWIDEFPNGINSTPPRQANGEILGWNAPELDKSDLVWLGDILGWQPRG